MMDWSAAGWIVMGIGMVLFWGLVILGIVLIVRALVSDERRSPERPEAAQERSALEALDHNLAEGTIGLEDYKERRRLLSGSI